MTEDVLTRLLLSGLCLLVALAMVWPRKRGPTCPYPPTHDCERCVLEKKGVVPCEGRK